MEDIISHITEEWFLTEPLIFSVYCTHQLAENTKMSVPMRTGKMRIEYNPDILQNWKTDAIEERLRYEVIRILLGHPYQRHPYMASKSILGIASDITLTDSYHKISSITLIPGLEYPPGLCFEEYFDIVNEFFKHQEHGGIPGGPESNGYYREAAESAELWEEDQFAAALVRKSILRITHSKEWGSIRGDLKDEIEAMKAVRIDYRMVLSCFRSTVLCNRRHLTRMIPSRRYGFQYMGSKREFSTKLLVAIDASGSMHNRQIEQALSIINRFFKYGIEKIDVIIFDVDIRGNVLPMKKAQKELRIEGRGGTDFQVPIDYFIANRYDGLIMITDGMGPEPKLPQHFSGNILWMLSVYGKSIDEIEARGIATFRRSRYIILPPA